MRVVIRFGWSSHLSFSLVLPRGSAAEARLGEAGSGVRRSGFESQRAGGARSEGADGAASGTATADDLGLVGLGTLDSLASLGSLG